MARLSKKASLLLEKIEQSGENGMYAKEADLAPLLKNDLVEVNPEVKNDAGDIAVRLKIQEKDTMSAPAMLEEQPDELATLENKASEPSEPSEPAAAMEISGIVTGIELPKSTRTRTPKYPFEQVVTGGSFFVADTEGRDAHKALASTVSSMNARYSAKTGNVVLNGKGNEVEEKHYSRKFVVRRVDDGAPWGFPGKSGAAVFRTI